MGENPPRPPSASSRRLSVLRIKEKQTAHVLFLDDGPILGMFTHYIGRNSEICHGEECRSCRGKQKRIWKGYRGLLWHDVAAKTWVPTVLEVTESLELDFRGKIGRGQEWLLTRGESTATKKATILGTCAGKRELPEHLRPFDFHATIHTVYHDWSIRCEAINPMPARIFVSTVDLAGPGDNGKAAEKPSPEQLKKFKERMGGLIGSMANGIGEMPKGGEA